MEGSVMKTVVALGGDGIGPEVVDAACYVLENMGVDLEIVKPPCGEKALKEYGTPFPKETMELTNSADAVLFGASGEASVIILAYLRWFFDTYANVRPVKYYEGVLTSIKNPEGVDFVIIRENTEDFYPGREGDISLLAERMPDYKDILGRRFADYGEGKFAVGLYTVKGCRRIAEFACKEALKRKRKGFPGKVTCVTKSNVLRETGGLFQRMVEEEVRRHPELTYEHFYVDDMARRIVRFPREMDVIVTTNMFGDILSDLAAELMGGLGMAPSACIGDKHAYFEPVHGSAPDIAGKGIANPTATILSCVMMLEYLGMEKDAGKLEKAVAEVYRKGETLTPDMGGTAKTMEVAEAILRELM
ncbi:MAG: isocitrate/isopropylmalate dehydrogenase family protein [Candidatus Jordarchaeales archaeon]